MPKVKKADRADLELIHGTSLRGISDESAPLQLPTDEDPVDIQGATLQDFRLTPRGFGYELKILIPLDQEEKLPALRRLAFQRLVNLNITASDNLMWGEDDG